VELWTKRDFTCDCPTETMSTTTACDGEASGSASSSSRKCALKPAQEQPQPPNEGNRYSHNFRGEFCRCGRAYDPVTECEAMVHCIGCEVSPSPRFGAG
jgi:E3 ubiquitin-protein ligase UBR7